MHLQTTECTTSIPLLPYPGILVEVVLPTCGCCWASLGRLFLWGLTKCGSALHPSIVPAQQVLDMPPYVLEMESAEAATEAGEASLLRAELDSEVQCCDGAVGETSKPSSSCLCFLQCSEKTADARATGGVIGAAPSASALVTCLLFKS